MRPQRSTCTLPDCNRAHFARGWCFMHYKRWRKHGDPTITLRPELTLSFEERFWSKVEKTESCWLWIAYLNAKGYGVASVAGTARLAHRIAYELTVGAVPEGLQLDHLCRTRRCVRPDHLEPVTNKENQRRGATGILLTHCRHGHPYVPENVYTSPKGIRRCRQCHRDSYHRDKAFPVE